MAQVQIEKPKSLSQVVAEEIKEAILRGDFRPGDKLAEINLTHSFGVSRTPLREAFRQLSAEGYITVVPYKGAFVSRLSEQEVLDIYAITSVLEGLATYLSTSRIRAGQEREDLLALFAEVKRRHEQGEVDAYWDANSNFHQFIADNSGNERLQQLIHNLRRQILKTRVLVLSYPGRFNESMAEHEEILAAILAGEAKKAESLVIAHLEKQGRFLIEMIGPVSPSEKRNEG